MKTGRRVRQLRLAADVLMQFLKEPISPGVTSEGIPADAHIIGVLWDWPATIVLMIESSEFEPAEEGKMIPEMPVRFVGSLGGGGRIGA